MMIRSPFWSRWQMKVSIWHHHRRTKMEGKSPFYRSIAKSFKVGKSFSSSRMMNRFSFYKHEKSFFDGSLNTLSIIKENVLKHLNERLSKVTLKRHMKKMSSTFRENWRKKTLKGRKRWWKRNRKQAHLPKVLLRKSLFFVAFLTHADAFRQEKNIILSAFFSYLLLFIHLFLSTLVMFGQLILVKVLEFVDHGLS